MCRSTRRSSVRHPDAKPGSIEPIMKFASFNLNVTPTQRRLKLSISQSTTQAKPGQKVDYKLTVTNANGKPVHAEIGLALVDKAVLSLANMTDLGQPDMGALQDTFYSDSPAGYCYPDYPNC